MAHGAKEGGLRLVRVFRALQCLRKGSVLLHRLARLAVDVRESCADGVNYMVVAVLYESNACNSEHLVFLDTVLDGKIAMREHNFVGKSRTDVLWIDKAQEPFPVSLRDTMLGVFGEALLERKDATFPHLVLEKPGGSPHAQAFVFIEIGIIDAPVIRSHGGNHAVSVTNIHLRLRKVRRCLEAIARNRLKHVVYIFDFIVGVNVQSVQELDVFRSVLFRIVSESASAIG